MELISKTLDIESLKNIIFGIMLIGLISSSGLQNTYAHEPSFEVRTSEDILRFCEFFHDEYKLLGVESLTLQHPSYPNIRACVILYNHVAWNSTHQARDLVLLSEIEKYLGDSSYIKERHLKISNIMPSWIKKDAQLWIDNVNSDTDFAYGIRTMIEAGVIFNETRDRKCDEGRICFEEGDFIKYSHTDKFKNVITVKHEVYSIDSEEVILKIDETSKEGTSTGQMNLNFQGLIMSEKCCEFYEYAVLMPIALGDVISKDLKILSETTYTVDGKIRPSLVARDSSGQNVKIIDKETGLVFSHEFHETEVLTVGDETKITATNFFDAEHNSESYDTAIPMWWKTTTKWLLEEKISESEYLQAMENLISRNILKV